MTPVEQLIGRLKALQIETARTIELLEIARSEENTRNQTQARSTPTVVTTTNNRTTPAAIATPVATLIEATDSTNEGYVVGDRVIITNATKGNHDRRATVIRITNSRVCLRTDDNQHTWRAAKNLRLESRR
jgi:hypothetical protein